MNLSDNWNRLYIFLTVSYFVTLAVASSFMRIPVGTDVHFHFDVARVWASGGNGMFCDRVFEVNLFPYPPVFHWLLVPGVWLGIEFLWAKLMQILLPFLIYLATTQLMMRHTSPKATVATALILLSTIGFTDGTIQCRPQGFAMILLPVALHALTSERGRKLVASSSLIGYAHGIAGLANLWLPMLRKLLNKKMYKPILTSILLLAPLVTITAIYFGGALDKWGGHMDTYQEYLLFTQPHTMIPYYAGTSLIGWIFVAYTLLKWNEATEFQKTLCLSVLGLTVMIPFWADRFLQYAIVALSCLAGMGLARNRRIFIILIPLISVMALLVQVNIYWVTFTNNWWLYPP